MLSELHIRNLLLIARADIEFASGLNVLTGETGAGKSLLVDALGFLLGARGDADLVRAGEAQAEVSARFILSDPELVEFFTHQLGLIFEDPSVPAELVLSRTLPRSGRPRAYANGRPLALPGLKELGERLLDIHGQHQNQSLLRPATRLEILDRFAQASAECEAVRRAHQEALHCAGLVAELRRAARDRQGREDMMRFQLKELEEARLEELEPERLEGEVRLLRDAERIRAAAASAAEALDGEDERTAAALLARSARAFDALGDPGPEAATLRERLQNLLAELREAARDAAALAAKAKSDPERLADLEERRGRLRALERKHGRDLQALRELEQKLRLDLRDIEQLEVRTEEREAALSAAIRVLSEASQKLSRRRKAAARELEKRVQAELSELGLKGAQLQAALKPHASDTVQPGLAAASPQDEASALLPVHLKSTGAEALDLLFTANPDVAPRPLKECASGGEISRVMLSLKGVLARMGGADRLPVVVFDEVDTGIGGRLGAVLGKKLRALAKVRQVLCVTHQPQIAVYALRQLHVEKRKSGGTTSVCVEMLADERRIDELAKMLRGESASAHTRAEAEAMLREAQRSRPA